MNHFYFKDPLTWEILEIREIDELPYLISADGGRTLLNQQQVWMAYNYKVEIDEQV